MPLRAVGTTDAPAGANVAEYRVRERTVDGVLVGEQRVIPLDDRIVTRRAAISSYRINGGATAEANLFALLNNAPAGTNHYLGIRGLSVQLDSTGANTNPNVQFRLFKDAIPTTSNADGTTGIYGGTIVPGGGSPFDTAEWTRHPNTSAEYQALIQADPNLVAYFPLQEASGNIASTVGGYSGSPAGSPTYRRRGPFGDDYSINFNANNEYFMVPFAHAALTEYSFEFLIRFNAPQTGVHVLSRASAWSATATHFGLRTNTDAAGSAGALMPRVAPFQGDGTNVGSIGPLKHLAIGQWHHVMVRKGAGTGAWTTHINGINDGGASTTGPAVQTTGTPQLNVGIVTFSGQTAIGGTPDYDLAHVAIYKRTFTPAEIFQRYRTWAPYIESRWSTPQEGTGAAGITAVELVGTAPSAAARLITQVGHRTHTAVEQQRLEDYRLQTKDDSPVVLGPQEWAVVRTGLPASGSHNTGYQYIINSAFEEFQLP